jgi:RNA polymerase-binding protein DksA
MIGEKTLSNLRKKLLERRRAILDFQRDVNLSWQTLHEPEKELEESASKETMSRGLEQLDARSQQEIRAIDDALTKMEEGEYGICETCGRQITIKRLRAIPWAAHCIQCANMQERSASSGPMGTTVLPKTTGLSDREMLDAIADELRTDDRVDPEELDISCEEGVVYLEGILPSETEHQILLEVIEDTLGFDEIVDNLNIDQQAWERRERRLEEEQDSTADAEVTLEEEDTEVDLHTSWETGEPMTPPDHLIPE